MRLRVASFRSSLNVGLDDFLAVCALLVTEGVDGDEGGANVSVYAMGLRVAFADRAEDGSLKIQG